MWHLVSLPTCGGPFAGKIADAATVSLPGSNVGGDAGDFVQKEIIEPHGRSVEGNLYSLSIADGFR